MTCSYHSEGIYWLNAQLTLLLIGHPTSYDDHTTLLHVKLIVQLYYDLIEDPSFVVLFELVWIIMQLSHVILQH